MIQSIFRFYVPNNNNNILCILYSSKTHYAMWKVQKLLNYNSIWVLIFKTIISEYDRKINKMLVKSIDNIIGSEYLFHVTFDNKQSWLYHLLDIDKKMFQNEIRN